MYIINMKIIICLFFCLILCSCGDTYSGCVTGKAMIPAAMKSSSQESNNSDDWDGCTGPPDPPDDIKLSSEELWFNAEGGIDSITTESEDWYLSNNIAIEDTAIVSFVNGEITNIKTSWLTLDKPNKKKIIFYINKNETKKERKLSVALIGRRSYAYINVNQSAE